MSEREVYRLANDLRQGNAEDAVNVFRRELQMQPQLAVQELKQANALAGPNARLHLGTRSDGEMALVNNSGRAVAHLGNLQQLQYARYDNYQNNRFDGYNGYQNNSFDGSLSQNRGQVGRLANDLARGDTRDAARTLQSILRYSDDPSRTIMEANRLADQMAARMGYRSAMEHIAQTRNGDLAVVDRNGRMLARVENYANSYDNRYTSYPNNSSYYQGGSTYYDGRPSYAPFQNQNSNYWGNSAYNDVYAQSRYNTGDIYAQSRYNGSAYNDIYAQSRYNSGAYNDIYAQSRYNNNRFGYNGYNGYSNYGDIYSGRMNGNQAAALGIGLIGGLILSNINRNNNHNFHNRRY